MAVATEIQVRDKLYIGGEWVDPTGSETIDVVNSTTEEVIGRIPQGTPEDVDRRSRRRGRRSRAGRRRACRSAPTGCGRSRARSRRARRRSPR